MIDFNSIDIEKLKEKLGGAIEKKYTHNLADIIVEFLKNETEVVPTPTENNKDFGFMFSFGEDDDFYVAIDRIFPFDEFNKEDEIQITISRDFCDFDIERIECDPNISKRDLYFIACYALELVFMESASAHEKMKYTAFKEKKIAERLEERMFFAMEA